MKVAGIVCEYNPFHNGHKYHIEETRKSGVTHIVCAMSGNFVQRGECAVVDKWARAKAAVLSGADLVVEIPTPWACSGAENFARAAVTLLSSLSIDILSFGCEIDNYELLLKAAMAVDSPKIGGKIKELISSGTTYPLALQKAVGEVFGNETAMIFAEPNNTLAVEYIRQKEKLGVDFDFLPIKRVLSSHNDNTPANNYFSSASAIRKIEDPQSISQYIPKAMYDEIIRLQGDGLYPCLAQNANRAVIASLRTMLPEEIKLFVPDENGLAERIFSKSRTAENMAELIKSVKTKNFTEAAVRRAVMLCFLQIPKRYAKKNPPYVKILAANKKGFEILREKKSILPIITQKSQADKLDSFSKEIYALECSVTDKFSLFSKKIPGCSREQTSPIIVI